ncbi:MAG: WYL domain-containing protein [Syntrophomonadaceae bacterium]|nr:WYL domain-containing protein [Syntrophomonadaceae bacterium]
MDESKAERILVIYRMLLNGIVVKRTALAQKFSVSEKTIQRDIEQLRIIIEKEPGGGLVFDRKLMGYVLRHDEQKVWLTNAEILALIKVLLESRAFPKAEMNVLVDKLILLGSQDQHEYIKKVVENEKNLYLPLKHNKELFQIIWELSDAIRRNSQVDIEYERVSDGKVKKSTIMPVGLIFSEFYFYMVAYIKGSKHEYPAIYRLDRVINYKLKKDHFVDPGSVKFKEGELRKRIQFMQAGEFMTIRFRFWGESLEAVLDRLPTAEVIEKDEKGVVVKAEVFGRGIKMWLLSQAQNIEVLYPMDLREEMAKTIKEMNRMYISKKSLE